MNSDQPAPGDGSVDIRELHKGDAESLIQCVRRCYGDSYPDPTFYDPQHLGRMLGTGELLSVGAVVGDRVVGHIGTIVVDRQGGIGDSVGGIVDPDYRGRGLMLDLGAQLSVGYKRLGIVATRHLATAVHQRTQKPLVASGAVAMGVLLGHVPAATDYRGFEHTFGDARIAVVAYFQSYRPLGPLEVHVPDDYAQPVEALYRQSGLDRQVVPGSSAEVEDAGPRKASLEGRVHHDEKVGITTFRFGPTGADPDQPPVAVIDDEAPRCQPVSYADVPIAHPHSAGLMNQLRARGFGFGALLPGTEHSESIRLQRLPASAVAPSAIEIAAPGGDELVEWVLADHHPPPEKGAGTH